MGFTKLDEGILQSSVMAADPVTFKVWIALLAACKADGVAPVAPTFLASVCRLTDAQVRGALVELAGPDPDSRGTEADGRRIERVNGGWRVINYAQYRREGLRAAESEARSERRRSAPPARTVSGQGPDCSASASPSVVVPLGEGVGGEPQDERPADRYIRGTNFRAACDLDVKILRAVRQLVEATGEPPHVWMRKVTSYKRPDGTMTAGVEDPARLGSVRARELALADAEWHLAEIAKEREAKRGA